MKLYTSPSGNIFELVKEDDVIYHLLDLSKASDEPLRCGRELFKLMFRPATKEDLHAWLGGDYVNPPLIVKTL